MEKDNMGCCNMLIWDFILIMIVSCTLIPNTVHLVFRIIIGLVITVLFSLILQLPVLGIILNIAVGLFWVYFFWEIMGLKNVGFIRNDLIWNWTVKIILGLVCVGLHIASNAEMGMVSERPSFSGRKKFKSKEWTAASDFSWFTDDAAKEYQKEENKKEDKREKNNYGENFDSGSFNPFAGCMTKDSIMKRYKSLSKNFHPDMEDGDTEQMQILNALCQEKLKEFE